GLEKLLLEDGQRAPVAAHAAEDEVEVAGLQRVRVSARALAHEVEESPLIQHQVGPCRPRTLDVAQEQRCDRVGGHGAPRRTMSCAKRSTAATSSAPPDRPLSASLAACSGVHAASKTPSRR